MKLLWSAHISAVIGVSTILRTRWRALYKQLKFLGGQAAEAGVNTGVSEQSSDRVAPSGVHLVVAAENVVGRMDYCNPYGDSSELE